MPKLTRLRQPLRETAKWGGLAATLVLCVIWIGSRWWTFAWPSKYGPVLLLSQGTAAAGWISTQQRQNYPPRVRLAGPGLREPAGPPQLRLWQWGRAVPVENDSSLVLLFPIWLPLLLTASITALAWRTDLLARQRARIGKCIACGYALDGLPPDAPCPECGKRMAAL